MVHALAYTIYAWYMQKASYSTKDEQGLFEAVPGGHLTS